MKPFLSLLALCLACTDPQVIGQSTAAIAGGTASDNDSIVGVFVTSSGTNCTGAVIGPRHVLLGRSCLYNGDSLARPSDVRVITGATFRAPTGTFDGESIVALPGEPIGMPTENDLAVVITTEDIGVAALSIAGEAPVVDDTLTIVGYGTTGAGSGVRTEAMIPVTRLMDTLVFSEDDTTGVCGGDGPALNAAGELTATALYVLGTGCPNDGAAYRAVTPYRDFIDEALAPMTESDAGIGDAGSDAAGDDAGTPDAGSDAGSSPDTGAMANDAGNDAGGGASGGGCAIGGAGTLGGPAWLLMLMMVWRRRRS